MKRSPMPPRRTPLKRSGPPARTRLRSTRKPLPRVSARRDAERSERDACRRFVIERDGGRCQGWGIDGVPHDHATAYVEPGREAVHEITGGAHRSTAYLVPDLCVTTCWATNGWISNGSPREAERRGLRVPLGASPAMCAEAETLRTRWRAGETPNPSWFIETEE